MADSNNNNSSGKRFAVIGAGVSGAAVTKALLDEGFNDVVVFEKSTYTFGLWRFQAEVDQNGTGSVMRSTVISTSKEMSAISNFPPPASAPNYMHNTTNVNKTNKLPTNTLICFLLLLD